MDRRSLWTDERAVSAQIGAVLLLGFLVLSLAAYQVTVVPAQNEGIEFRHSQQVQSQLVDVRNGIVRAAVTGTSQPRSVTLGTEYPTRAVAVNPAPASGSLRTVPFAGDSNVTVANSTALDVETADYWNRTRNFSTLELVYRPDYNEYASAPVTRLENGLLYTDDGTRERNRTDQRLVDGRQLTLLTLNGSLSTTRVESRTIDVRALSPESTDVRTIAVRNETGRNVTVTVPTRRSEATWRGLLADELAPDGYVADVSVDETADELTVRMVRGETYELRVTQVAVGRNVANTPPAYLTAVGGVNRTLTAGGTYDLVVEARDRFNNPEPGVRVSAAGLDQSGSENVVVNRTTDEDGRVRFAFEPVGTGRETVRVRINGSRTPEKVVEYDLRTVERTVRTGAPTTTAVAWEPLDDVPGLRTNFAEECGPTVCPPLALGVRNGAGDETTYGNNDTSVVQLDRSRVTGLNGTAVAVNSSEYWTDAVGTARLNVSTPDGESDDLVVRNLAVQSFEGGNHDDPPSAVGWSRNGTPSASNVSIKDVSQTGDPQSPNSNFGSKFVQVAPEPDGNERNVSLVSPDFDTSDAGMVTVQYYSVEFTDPDPGTGASDVTENESLRVEYRQPDGSWALVDTEIPPDDAGSNPTPEFRRVRITAPEAAHADFAVRFRQRYATFSEDEWGVDDVKITTYRRAG